MRAGTVLAIGACGLALGGAVRVPPLVDQQARLAIAKRDAATATRRADRLATAAAAERDAAERARAEERALAARVSAAEADLTAAQARVAIVDRLLAAQRARLGVVQAPVARLLAALESLARRPTIVAVAQPGSVDDLVHVRAVLGSTLPVVRVRTQGVRAALAETRRLQDSALLAATALRDSRARLEADRIALAQLEATHRRRSVALRRGALSESDRALALGERARDLVDDMAEAGSAEATAASLAGLPSPTPRPVAAGSVRPAAPRGVYQVPVAGRLVTGFDEVSDAGVRSRGLTFATAPAAAVVAPAAGIVRYARRFRAYGRIVILDHGDGWTSLVTGLDRVVVAPGQRLAAGATLGTAPGGDDPRVTVELRRRGRPVDAAALIG
ncbi:peptidoglycan DD-metalloendopeptidase family protein [Sphingomonas ginsenosidivorax]|uniref:Peptidoglycan DD-metalloendopeptidase family protein n=1 Tax=Sphingomonas ginsenosidivorax TaxID=862135 RepID=A0A5C6U9N8_9SPHN|nr:peptidoglycan DD-metalloendopeptidase family protein [Sphingomonas ginsenosidivorax]TXC69697.1 peptidoglycan DD-metalloendopeptidase family protein [Sphingomonas ginsenosidivorax]